MDARNDYVDALLEKPPGQGVLRALDELGKRDAHLLLVDANERSIAFRFAMYLQAHFKSYDVDSEYNRDGVDPKRINYMDFCSGQDDTEGQTVFPDVIVHRRGRSDENYLVIEIKKSTNSCSRDVDYRKLRGYKEQLSYEYALFVEIGSGDAVGQVRVEWH